MRVGAVDIGTNSMRMLIRDEDHEQGRWVEVTGLGRGVDSTGRLSEEAIDRTLVVLDDFGARMAELGVDTRSAIATSATRDADNREEFLDRVEGALGVRPQVISGVEEGHLAFVGATSDLVFDEPAVVTDIGGGSTELVTSDAVDSVDMGSVRLTDRMSSDYPLSREGREAAMRTASAPFIDLKAEFEFSTHIGVAGTWTSLAAMVLGLGGYDPGAVHGFRLHRTELDGLLDELCGMTLPEIEAIPSLDPKRAPVIRAGGIVARAVMGFLHTEQTVISIRDTLDGLAMRLLP